MGVERYLMLVEETNTIPAFHSELTTYSISRLFTLDNNCELKGVHKGFPKVKASGGIIVLFETGPKSQGPHSSGHLNDWPVKLKETAAHSI